MLVIIRITGQVDLSAKVKGTLDRLRVQKKYACTLWNDSKEIRGMLHKVEQYVGYGVIDKDLLRELVTKRGRVAGNKPLDPKIITDAFLANLEKGEYGVMKKFFTLHPPIGGFHKKTSFMFPRGVLGDHKDKIGLLLRRMII
ncbi:MAG: uL30 family ribosomal protein [archaeon]